MRRYANKVAAVMLLTAAAAGTDPRFSAASQNLNVTGQLTGPNILEACVQGDTAYLATQCGLVALDVSKPDRPAFLSCHALSDVNTEISVAVKGNYAYLLGPGGTNNTILRVLNVADPHAPAEAGCCTLSGTPRQIVLNDHYALAATSSGLHMINIANPAAPVEAGCNSVFAFSLAADNHHCYLSTMQGVAVFNLDNPAAIAPVGFCSVPGSAGLALSGTTVYVAVTGFEPSHEASGLQIVDVSDPAAPVAAGWCGVTGNALGVGISGNEACVYSDIYSTTGGKSAGLTLVDVALSDAPAALAFLPMERTSVYNYLLSHNVAGDGCLIYICNGGLQIVDISNAQSPARRGRYYAPPFGLNAAASGDYTYTTQTIYSAAGLCIINTADPARPACSNNFYWDDSLFSGFPTCMTLNGGRAYVYLWSDFLQKSSLRIIDVSDPNAPTERGFCEGAYSTWFAAVRGDYLYATNGGLSITDISNPDSPVSAGRYTVQGQRLYGLAVQDQWAYVLDNADPATGKFRVLDLSNPVSPVEVGMCTVLGTYWLPSVVAVQGQYAYAGGKGGLQIIDIHEPSAPAVVGTLTLGTPMSPVQVLKVAACGPYAYVLASDGKLHRINVSNPAAPVETDSYALPAATVFDLALQGGTAYVTTSSGLFLFGPDCCPSPTPTPVPTFTSSPTASPALTASSTPTGSATPAPMSSASASATPSPTPSPTPTLSPLPTSTVTPALPATHGKPCVAYPNPARGAVRFIWDEPNAERIQIDIFNLSGERIAVLRADHPGQGIVWQTTGIAPGVYCARIVLTVNGARRQLPVKKIAILH